MSRTHKALEDRELEAQPGASVNGNGAESLGKYMEPWKFCLRPNTTLSDISLVRRSLFSSSDKQKGESSVERDLTSQSNSAGISNKSSAAAMDKHVKSISPSSPNKEKSQSKTNSSGDSPPVTEEHHSELDPCYEPWNLNLKRKAMRSPKAPAKVEKISSPVKKTSAVVPSETSKLDHSWRDGTSRKHSVPFKQKVTNLDTNRSNFIPWVKKLSDSDSTSDGLVISSLPTSDEDDSFSSDDNQTRKPLKAGIAPSKLTSVVNKSKNESDATLKSSPVLKVNKGTKSTTLEKDSTKESGKLVRKPTKLLRGDQRDDKQSNVKPKTCVKSKASKNPVKDKQKASPRRVSFKPVDTSVRKSERLGNKLEAENKQNQSGDHNKKTRLVDVNIVQKENDSNEMKSVLESAASLHAVKAGRASGTEQAASPQRSKKKQVPGPARKSERLANTPKAKNIKQNQREDRVKNNSLVDRNLVEMENEMSSRKYPKRQRFPPMESWRGQRVEYKRDGLAWTAIGVEEGAPCWEWSQKITMDVDVKKKVVQPKNENACVEEHEKSFESLFKSTEDVKPTPQIKIWNPLLCKETLLDCVQRHESYQFKLSNDVPDATKYLAIAKPLQNEKFALGLIVLEARTEKGVRSVHENTVVYWIRRGIVEVTISETKLILGENDSFYVPAGNSYNLVNLSDVAAEFVFFQLK